MQILETKYTWLDKVEHADSFVEQLQISFPQWRNL
jgi:hypothetical protein